MADMSTRIITADLGPTVAALTVNIDGQPAAVVNEQARTSPTLQRQAAWALLCAGLDAGLILGALYGVRR